MANEASHEISISAIESLGQSGMKKAVYDRVSPSKTSNGIRAGWLKWHSAWSIQTGRHAILNNGGLLGIFIPLH